MNPFSSSPFVVPRVACACLSVVLLLVATVHANPQPRGSKNSSSRNNGLLRRSTGTSRLLMGKSNKGYSGYDNSKYGGEGFYELGQGECMICDKGNKEHRPGLLRVKYISGQGQISNYQDAQKATCRDQDFPAETTITAYGVEYKVTDGDEFSIGEPDVKMDAETDFTFSRSNVDCYIHTSCSQPLVAGDQIGPFLIMAGGDCEFTEAQAVEPFCGDGIVNPIQGETCDPPTTDYSGDMLGACREDCTRCGDGIVDPIYGEECDDGAAMQWQLGDGVAWYGTENCKACAVPYCGDGMVDQGETCDPPGSTDMVGAMGECREDCSYCGDGVINNDEECDDGGDMPESGCDACVVSSHEPSTAPSFQPSSVPSPDPSSAPSAAPSLPPSVSPYCGDGVVDTLNDETCDPPNSMYGACREDCTYCGDGILHPWQGEECDLGAEMTMHESGDSVWFGTEECKACKIPYCGDGITDQGETCDPPGSSIDMPGTTTAECRSDCSYCGDGNVNEDEEECDDGPDMPTSTCDACKIPSSPPSTMPSSVPSPAPSVLPSPMPSPAPSSEPTVSPFCGDNITDTLENETCDPPGSMSGACREDCTYCGDGIVHTMHGEQCDAGGNMTWQVTNGVRWFGTDDCKACKLPLCGDGQVDTLSGETCEPPGISGCRIDCTSCGDGILNGEEECDEGNLMPSPTCDGCLIPSAQPSVQHSLEPSSLPSSVPSLLPTPNPSPVPSALPSFEPSIIPSRILSPEPSTLPSTLPSSAPSLEPTSLPSQKPSARPSYRPSLTLSAKPSIANSGIPSVRPSPAPSSTPSTVPSSKPSHAPSREPSEEPSAAPSSKPSIAYSVMPSPEPSSAPSSKPSYVPSLKPSFEPSPVPSSKPSYMPSLEPSSGPSSAPSSKPSNLPSLQPSSEPSPAPSSMPSIADSSVPSARPSIIPSLEPSFAPTLEPTSEPSLFPSSKPSNAASLLPSHVPSHVPSSSPSEGPSPEPSRIPSTQPSIADSEEPSVVPSPVPSIRPSPIPSVVPSPVPSLGPSYVPSIGPSPVPSVGPSPVPSTGPSPTPSIAPSSGPTQEPTDVPSQEPTATPSEKPTSRPSNPPSAPPSIIPSGVPTFTPSSKPSFLPSLSPSSKPSWIPSSEPSSGPSPVPSSGPSSKPSSEPSSTPSEIPTHEPSDNPSPAPSLPPSLAPSREPSEAPSECICEATGAYDVVTGSVTIDFDFCGEAVPKNDDFVAIYPCELTELMVADEAWFDNVCATQLKSLPRSECEQLLLSLGYEKDAVYPNRADTWMSFTCGSPGDECQNRNNQDTIWPSSGSVTIDPNVYWSARWAFQFSGPTLDPGCYKVMIQRETTQAISAPPYPTVCKDWYESNHFIVPEDQS